MKTNWSLILLSALIGGIAAVCIVNAVDIVLYMLSH